MPAEIDPDSRLRRLIDVLLAANETTRLSKPLLRAGLQDIVEEAQKEERARCLEELAYGDRLKGRK